VLSSRCIALIAPAVVVWACQSHTASAPVGPPPIEVRDPRGVVTARVFGGHPCRATVDGVELQVGGRPLVAMLGSSRFTGEDAPNGTTLRKNDVPVARIHADQLFDSQGIPLMRIAPNGDISNAAGVVSRKAAASDASVVIGDLTITGTTNIALAAMLTTPEAPPEIRALAACNYLLIPDLP
jgi:hypothetical protein